MKQHGLHAMSFMQSDFHIIISRRNVDAVDHFLHRLGITITYNYNMYRLVALWLWSQCSLLEIFYPLYPMRHFVCGQY